MDVRQLARFSAGALILAVAPFLAAEAAAGEDLTSLQRTLESRFPKMKIVDVKPGPIPQIYEVFTGTSIVYADKSGNYLISGSIVDSRTQKNLTQDRVNERNAIEFASLPFDQAIRIVKGNGSRKLAVFSDPDCPYCRRLEESLKSVNDVTMYVFLFPLTRIHPQAEQRAKAIWCSGDRAQAWTQYMLEKKEPAAAACTGDPMASTLALGQKLNVGGTPTLYFEDGSRISGALSAENLEERLKRAKETS